VLQEQHQSYHHHKSQCHNHTSRLLAFKLINKSLNFIYLCFTKALPFLANLWFIKSTTPA
jgi:hypothetical protein